MGLWLLHFRVIFVSFVNFIFGVWISGFIMMMASLTPAAAHDENSIFQIMKSTHFQFACSEFEPSWSLMIIGPNVIFTKPDEITPPFNDVHNEVDEVHTGLYPRPTVNIWHFKTKLNFGNDWHHL